MFASGRAVAASPHAGSSAPHPRIVLGNRLPNLVRIGDRQVVIGRVLGSPRRAQVALESARETRWRVMASTTLRRRGEFSLRWRVGGHTAIGPLKLRLVVTRAGRLLAATSPFQSAVGSAPVYCARPVPPALAIPAGEGWIAGGLYEQGGAYPGFYRCTASSYTVTATSISGAVLARQTVTALHSYTLVVPAGSYTLTSGFCRGSATVTAGRQTTANTYCDFP